MIILNSLDEFHKIYFPAGKKWQRCFEAIYNHSNILPNVFYLVGDSLVYRLSTGESTDVFEGSRRYFDIHYYLQVHETIEYREKEDLTLAIPYSDESDRDFFHGTGLKARLSAGQVAIFNAHEAYRFTNSNEIKK